MEALRESGHDVVWAGDLTPDPGDQAILAQAREEKRILVTLDKDFGERAIVYGEPHCGIIRLVGIRARRQADYCQASLQRYGDALSAGAIVTVETSRTGVRLAD